MYCFFCIFFFFQLLNQSEQIWQGKVLKKVDFSIRVRRSHQLKIFMSKVVAVYKISSIQQPLFYVSQSLVLLQYYSFTRSISRMYGIHHTSSIQVSQHKNSRPLVHTFRTSRPTLYNQTSCKFYIGHFLSLKSNKSDVCERLPSV